RQTVYALALALQPAPATGVVVGNNLLEHGREGGRVDRFVLANGHGAGGLVVVPGRDDAFGIWDDGAVIQKYVDVVLRCQQGANVDRKSTRLNSSHVAISYAVFCLKKKNNKHTI